jgi:hypothetical protein
MATLSLTRKEGLDKFYTIPNIVDNCITTLGQLYNWESWDLVVEPSAGSGNFYTKIPSSKKIGMDILPEHSEVKTQDFFTYCPEQSNNKIILTIGNPPFGKVSSLAIKFFNHSAKFSRVIAFIIPRTFRRISVQNKLDLNFHLVSDTELPLKPCCFEPPMNVKCCFQVWEKRDQLRELLELKTEHTDWDFLSFGPKDNKGQPTPPEGADFALRAYGGKCGEIVTIGLDKLRPKSWHWIKSNINLEELMTRFKSLDYSQSQNTARQNSIGKGDLVSLYESVV